MAMNEPFDWRRYDRRLFAAAAVLFPILIVIGFARTFYLKFAFDTPPLRSTLVVAHGLVMTLWVLLFIAQVWLIRTKNHRTHMKLGMLGIALAIVVLVSGFFTAVGGAKFGTAITPNDPPPLQFLAVPFFDLVVFAILFTAAIVRRKRPADHKRLMLLTAIGFLPPALGRFPVDALLNAGPPFFFGVPAAIALGVLAVDTWRNRKLNVPFLIGSIILIASYPLRLMLMETQPWLTFATWLTTWAA